MFLLKMFEKETIDSSKRFVELTDEQKGLVSGGDPNDITTYCEVGTSTVNGISFPIIRADDTSVPMVNAGIDP